MKKFLVIAGDDVTAQSIQNYMEIHGSPVNHVEELFDATDAAIAEASDDETGEQAPEENTVEAGAGEVAPETETQAA